MSVYAEMTVELFGGDAYAASDLIRIVNRLREIGADVTGTGESEDGNPCLNIQVRDGDVQAGVEEYITEAEDEQDVAPGWHWTYP